MTQDMIQVAKERQKYLDKCIAEREAEIAEYRAEAEKLDVFVGLATELFVPEDSQDAPQPQAATPKPQQHAAAPNSVEYPKVSEQQRAQQSDVQRPVQGDQQRVMPARQPRTA
ncbi:MAG: hypothetical protein AAF718_08540 [Pseudomonadota bacterium]